MELIKTFLCHVVQYVEMKEQQMETACRANKNDWQMEITFADLLFT